MLQIEGATFLRKLRQIVVAQCPSHLSDEELVRQFLTEKDEASFALLVRRHGPMVLAVCKNVLHHQQDAEDVFQATFLLLARKAGTIRKQQSLSSWLHGVAYRLSLKARTQLSRRHQRERSAPPPNRSDAGDDLTLCELRVILHEELNRLPEKYRTPLLLCYWEGKTRDEAAQRLGMTGDALKKRLERARSLLGSRLTQRGLVPTIAIFTWLITENGARAAVSTVLIHHTAQAAVAFASAHGTIVGASTAAVTLAKGAIRTMFLTKCIATLLALLAAIGVGTALSFAGYQALTEKQADNGQGIVLPPQAKPKAAQKTDAERIVGTWRVTKGVANGKAMPEIFNQSARITFAKNGNLSIDVAGDNAKKLAYKLLDADKIDWSDGSRGIYQFDGEDRLTICMAEGTPAPKRPAGFASETGSKTLLIALERSAPLTPAEIAKLKAPVAKTRETAARQQAINAMRQIGLAMHNHDSSSKAFPTHAIYSKDGKTPLLSWRVAILPFIEQSSLYNEFKLDEPWDSAHNKILIVKMPKLYENPLPAAQNAGKTYFQVFTGPGTAFDGNKRITAANFGAGLGKIALMTEAKDPVIWTKPDDLVMPKEADKMPAVATPEAGILILMGDGNVRTLPRDTTPAALRALAISKK